MTRILFALLALALASAPAAASDYSSTIQAFRNAGQSAEFFDDAYGYAVFPTIGKGGLGIGGAYGKGRVYVASEYVGDATMTQLTVGFQAGGQAYSMIIFFQDQRAFDEFTSGGFELGAQATAVAITAGASVTASTAGSSAGVSGGRNDASTAGRYYKGTAVFTLARGGLMYEASVGGQKFNYRPR